MIPKATSEPKVILALPCCAQHSVEKLLCNCFPDNINSWFIVVSVQLSELTTFAQSSITSCYVIWTGDELPVILQAMRNRWYTTLDVKLQTKITKMRAQYFAWDSLTVNLVLLLCCTASINAMNPLSLLFMRSRCDGEGFESNSVLPAAEIAVETVNNNTSLLPEYSLHLNVTQVRIYTN